MLDKVFISPAIIVILRELSKRKAGITGREIARQTGQTHRTALKALDNLEVLKLVNREVAGKAYSFTLNRQHYLNKNIVANIFEVEKNFLSNINKDIKTGLCKYSESVILFGSVARHEDNYKSDFDICVVYKISKESAENSISELRENLNTKYGITLAPYFISMKNFAERAKKKKAPMADILKDGKVICGKTLKELQNG
ncbi:MAG: nucleotidyltransferase domain-containing protein [Ignavibacteriota bacterium]